MPRLKGKSLCDGKAVVSLFLASRRTEHIAFNAQICHLRGKVTLPACLNLNHSFLFLNLFNCVHTSTTHNVLTDGSPEILHSNLGTAGCNEVKGLERNGKKVESGLAT